jgi:hypothetical protein
MNKQKLILLTVLMGFFTTSSFSAMNKADCDKIKLKTGSDYLKKSLCKKGSDKLNADGSFKKGTFNIFKIMKKN